MQLVLQPCSDAASQKNFRATIQNPVSLELIEKHLVSEEQAQVREAFVEAVAVWGVKPGVNGGTAREWQKMQIGDTVLFYGEGKLFLRGTVAFKTQNPSLALALWSSDPKDGLTWECIYCLTGLEPIAIEVDSFNEAAGYAPKYVVRGFRVLPEEQSRQILEGLGLPAEEDETAPEAVDVDAERQALAALDDNLDLPVAARRRAEQALLRRIHLRGRRAAPCALCGRCVSSDLLTLGHIKRRHACDPRERKDERAVMLVCLLGCDRLFENGHVFVDEDGVVRAVLTPTTLPAVREALERLGGRQCSAWIPETDPYFKWHRMHLKTSGWPPNASPGI